MMKTKPAKEQCLIQAEILEFPKNVNHRQPFMNDHQNLMKNNMTTIVAMTDHIHCVDFKDKI